ncbi:glutaredoxin-C9-like [Lycium barbarum]|uniref:glutaredoxin-C9-like n=1 Tax=Lycium barbarum TaxID=112863 RepID=UPI00293EF639|nr:glutaredoxin-C9-like [Lycium barbarum]
MVVAELDYIGKTAGVTGKMVGVSSCRRAVASCMSRVVKCLLQCLGVNPVIYDIEEKDENMVVAELDYIGKTADGDRKDCRRLQFPVVFIGGELFGGLDRIMAAHISGEFNPVLKQSVTLWL